jgi:glycerate-2-kinase
MKAIIQNRTQLTSHGDVEGRGMALDIIDRAMAAIDASALTKARLRLEGEHLEVEDWHIDLSEVDRIFVLGAGKGVLQIAEALDQILGGRITAGLVIEKRLTDMPVARGRMDGIHNVEVLEAGHPLPDRAGEDGVRRMLDIARRAGEEDLVFVCVAGGCSALTTLPTPGLDLDQIRETTDVLLKSGADIGLLDVVRMGLTQLQGGALAERIHPARIVNLVVNDFVWSYPGRWREGETAIGWGPSVPVLEGDRRRLQGVAEELKTLGLWSALPSRVQEQLLRADLASNALTAEAFEEQGIRWRTVILADPETSAEAACEAAKEMGFRAMILSTAIEGEAAEVGTVLAGIAKEIAKNQRPMAPPCALIATGEMTVSLGTDSGLGGRNQECVLAAATKIESAEGIIIASVGTDGTDGPTEFAGGIVDGHTLPRAKSLRMDIPLELKGHNVSPALMSLGDAIQFNQPGNNVCDLSLILVR